MRCFAKGWKRISLIGGSFFIIALQACGAQQPDDSTALQINKPRADEAVIWQGDSIQRYNPALVTGMSALLPGSGQVYTRHYVKAGLFVAMEATFGGLTFFWRETARLREDEAHACFDRIKGDTTFIDSMLDREDGNVRHQNTIDAKYNCYNYLVWAAGAYVFNLFDALQHSNALIDTRERNPAVAGLLSAFPGLGMGQIYNGSFSKAGMTMMGQWSLGIMSYNSHRLMHRAEDNYSRFHAAMQADSLLSNNGKSADNLGIWSGDRSAAFTSRNMYLWYSIFFYFYSIFDAVVDAYLHDYPEKMRIEPDLVIGNKQLIFSLSTKF